MRPKFRESTHSDFSPAKITWKFLKRMVSFCYFLHMYHICTIIGTVLFFFFSTIFLRYSAQKDIASWERFAHTLKSAILIGTCTMSFLPGVWIGCTKFSSVHIAISSFSVQRVISRPRHTPCITAGQKSHETTSPSDPLEHLTRLSNVGCCQSFSLIILAFKYLKLFNRFISSDAFNYFFKEPNFDSLAPKHWFNLIKNCITG